MKKTTNTRAMNRRCHRTRRRRNPQKTRTGTRVLRRRNAQKTRTGTRTRARTQRSKVMRLTCHAAVGMKRTGGSAFLRTILPKDKTLTELDVSGQSLGVEGAGRDPAYLRAILPKGREPAYLRAILPKDKTLTELDVSGQSLRVEGALVIGRYLTNNGALVKLDMSNNGIIGATANAKAAGKALSNMLAVNTVLQELNISSNAPYGISDSGSFVTEFAVGLGANGVLTALDISRNKIQVMSIRLKAAGVKKMDPVDCEGVTWTASEDANAYDEFDATAFPLAAAIAANGALEKLLMANNKMASKEAGKALAEALTANPTLKELDVSSNTWNEYGEAKGDGPGFAQELAVGIAASGSLTSLHIGNNGMENAYTIFNEFIDMVEAKPAMKVLCAVPFRDKTLTELDVSGKSLGVEGALVIRRYVENNGAMTSLHIGNNGIPAVFMNDIIAMVEQKPAMKILCAVPFRNKTLTELDVSGKSLGVEGALVIGRYLTDNVALKTLNISNNCIVDKDAGNALGEAEDAKVEFIKALSLGLVQNVALEKLLMGVNGFKGVRAGMLLACTISDAIKELDLSGGQCNLQKCDAEFVRGLFLSDPAETLTSLNISNNYLLNKESGKVLAKMLKGDCALRNLDVSNNYSSDNLYSQDSTGFVKELLIGLSAYSVKLIKSQAHEQFIEESGKLKSGCPVVIFGSHIYSADNRRDATEATVMERNKGMGENYLVKVVQTGESQLLPRSNLLVGKINALVLNVSHNNIGNTQQAALKYICAQRSIQLRSL